METENKKELNPEIKLDRKSKILFIVLGILVVGSVAATYWRYMMKLDYIIQAQIDCDPETENCFVWKCDPNSLEEGEKCTGVPNNDIWYYKILNRNAKNIPNCDPKDENCAAYQCEPDEPECEIRSCDPASVGESEECSTPEQYLLENPPEEESECEEGDEECINESAEECAPDDEECMSELEEVTEECAPDDEECTSQPESETGETGSASQDAPADAAAPAQ